MNNTMNNTTFAPGPTPSTVCAADGRILTAPASWVLLSRGDAALTRRVKGAGEHWVVQEKKERKDSLFDFKSAQQIGRYRLTG
jgi:hypothetical protein